MVDFEENRDSLLESIEEMLRQKQYAALRDQLDELEPADIASLFEDLPEEALPLLFRILPKEPAAEVFVELDPEQQEMLIRGFSNTELKEVLDELYLDDAVDIVEEMPANVVKRILKHADPETRKQINEILKYPEDSAGSLMTTEILDLKRTMTVSDAFKRIRRTAADMETISVCYVTDEGRHLLGVVTIRTLLLAEEDDVVEELMDPNVIFVNTLDDREEVAQMFSKYDFLVMPVVDAEGRLVGIVTVDDAIDVMEEEATEDIEKMAAMLPSDKPYLKTGIFETWKARIPWLLLLMVSATFTGQIIAGFENALAATAILTAYIPMLMDTGGNCGGQASVTVIRGISLDEIEFSDLPRVVWKEIRVGVVCGATLAAANFLKIMFLDRLVFHNPITVTIAFVICATMLLTVVCAKVIGCVLPLLAKKMGFDPAVMSSPFITTLVDAVSLLIYFRFASALLGI
ncbi:MAG: magnesium transporter [Oscillospiraceae bacterium]|nr:magnesium transporter [Oscillospiraceae bacterium]MBQ1741715.1 magnesium transporter [Oscillospiraceae bacterium]MBQ2223440.1 magnesium transporter [Oscillospiraceae bacterium]MBQ5535848.1 magnesium transporter [Oscillospiraceae bacterium]